VRGAIHIRIRNVNGCRIHGETETYRLLVRDFSCDPNVATGARNQAVSQFDLSGPAAG
jgi:hypothetical protein